MIFIRRETFRQYLRLYPVTSAILLIIAIMFLLMEIFGSSTDPQTLIRFGALYRIPNDNVDWWRFITPVFLHIGFRHLLFNAFALFVFAPPLERLLGPLHYAAFFLVSGFIGNVFGVLFSGNYVVSAGASGAIFGVYAAYLYLSLFHKHALDEGTRKIVTIILVGGLILSFVPGVSLAGHLGGFLGGFLFFAILTRKFIRRRKS